MTVQAPGTQQPAVQLPLLQHSVCVVVQQLDPQRWVEQVHVPPVGEVQVSPLEQPGGTAVEHVPPQLSVPALLVPH